MRAMRPATVMLAALTLPILLTLTASPARAEVYPWCAVYGGARGGGATNCGFSTYEQCMTTVSGIGGFCERNQFYHPERASTRHRRQRRHQED